MGKIFKKKLGVIAQKSFFLNYGQLIIIAFEIARR